MKRSNDAPHTGTTGEGEQPSSDDPGSPRSRGGAACLAADCTSAPDVADVTATALPALERAITAVGEHLHVRGELRLRLVGDDEMSRTHHEHCGVAGTTDVITFDLTNGQSALGTSAVDADALLCVDEAIRQADARGIPLEHELALYAVHALLHCLGEDDRDEASHARMHAREDEILRSIGIGPVYATAESTSAGAAS